ncbi:methylated-DNA--[protein]-cysteine S-methyltransferase [Skermania sp. ID1734]|nr:methylated-DNA--[protein]-cysteine S-methyltransferase [Skermania sp. ID1734]
MTDDEPATLHRLHARLAENAAATDTLDVAYRTVDTPIGPLLLAATEHGLVRVAFAVEGHDTVLQNLAERISPRILAAPKRLDAAAHAIDEYFAGRPVRFELPLDLRLSRGFRLTVLEQLRRIGYGQRASYGTVAAELGSPRATRAVGTACATNPLPVVIPCHRVVRSDGSVGQYLAGPAVKRALLDLESGLAPHFLGHD